MITQRKKIKKKDTNGCVLASVYNLKSSRLAEMLLMVSFKVREIRPLMALKRLKGIFVRQIAQGLLVLFFK
jgi:hypothetical protein